MVKILRSRLIRITVRIAGLVAACISYANRDSSALATFGFCLGFEWWAAQEELSEAVDTVKKTSEHVNGLVDSVDAKITAALQYEYLSDPALIWAKAINFLDHTQPNDEIQSTAFFPNTPDFEKAVFEKTIKRSLQYSRLLCYIDPRSKKEHGFPDIKSIQAGGSEEDRLQSYLDWYDSFYEAWTQRGDLTKDAENAAMKTWYTALRKLNLPGKFRVLHYGFVPSSDYFIIRPHGSERWRAVIGFPHWQTGGMRAGFATTNPNLVNDLSKNWQRLWNQPRPLI